MTSQIPSFDIRRFTHPASPADRQAFVDELGAAYREWGFAGIRNHGIPQADIDAAYAAFKAFFALPEDVKRQYHQPGTGGARGLTPVTPVMVTAPRNGAKFPVGEVVITGLVQPGVGSPYIRVTDIDSEAVIVDVEATVSSTTDDDGWHAWSAEVSLGAGNYDIRASVVSGDPAEVVAAVARGFTWQHRAPQLAALYGELQRAGRART